MNDSEAMYDDDEGGAIVPAALLALVAPYLEDIVIAEQVRQHRAAEHHDMLTLPELDAELGFEPDEIEAAENELRSELGL